MFNTSLIFDSNDISLIGGVNIFNHDFNKSPERDIKLSKLARQSKSIVTTSDYVQKVVPVYGEACGANRQATESIISQIKALLQAQNKTLKVPQSGTNVEYQDTTMNEFNITWDGITAEFEIIFICADPIGVDTATTTLLNDSTTLSSDTFSVSVGGSFIAEPQFQITITAVTGGTAQDLTITNAGNGQGLTINRNWANGDIVIIDSETKTVLVNGVVHDYEGAFPRYYPGSQSIGYRDTFSTRNVSIEATYKRRFA